MPEQIGNLKLLAEGEGSLCAADQKRAPSDFVLWKKTKGTVKQKATEGEGFEDKKVKEPSWNSPWGHGRPGWHIECSVMSFYALQKLLGEDSSASASRKPIDVHAGGIDLKFPHHENEIAQSEAFSGSHQWVNYWLHTGHLNIDGSKMSKSLKNFITIRGALEHYTARQIRFLFLLHKYSAAMDYSLHTMTQAVTAERSFVEFFHNLKAILRRLGPVTGCGQHIGAAERELFTALDNAKLEVRESLLDDFDTPRAIAALLELIRSANKLSTGVTAQALSSTALLATGRYITAMLRVFGLVPGSISSDTIGFPLHEVSVASEEAGGEISGQTGQDKETLLTPFLDALSTFRSQVRAVAIAGDTKQVLSLTDVLRDELLPELGVRLEDLPGGLTSIWKLDDPALMRKERAQKEEIRHIKELEKQRQQHLQREREEKAKVPPEQLFRTITDLYSAFNEQGLPTHDKAGEPLPKNVIKKLQKDYDRQKEVHEKYLSKLQSSNQGQISSVDKSAASTDNL